MEIILAQVGYGYWGPNLLRSFNQVQGVRVSWLCDKKPGRLSAAVNRYKGLKTTADFKKIIDDREVNAVVIATEPVSHYELGKAVLESGKHLFMEKPLAMSSKQAETLSRLAKARKRIIGVGHVYLYHPAVEKLREIVKQGRLGAPVYLDLARVNPGPPSPKHDVIWDLAPHEASLALSFAKSDPVSVRATGLRWDQKRTEAAFIEVRFRNDVYARIHASWRAHAKLRHMDVYFERGAAFMNELAPNQLRIVYPSKDNRVGAAKSFSGTFSYGEGREETPRVEKAFPLEKECADFVKCIREGRAPRAGAALGVQVVQILEAASRSAARGGKEVRIK